MCVTVTYLIHKQYINTMFYLEESRHSSVCLLRQPLHHVHSTIIPITLHYTTHTHTYTHTHAHTHTHRKRERHCLTVRRISPPYNRGHNVCVCSSWPQSLLLSPPERALWLSVRAGGCATAALWTPVGRQPKPGARQSWAKISYFWPSIARTTPPSVVFLSLLQASQCLIWGQVAGIAEVIGAIQWLGTTW